MARYHSRRRIIAGAAALSAGIALPNLAFGQAAFPDKTKTIRGIVPLAAGSTVDALARLYAQHMSETLGTNVVIDNRPGAEFVIGIQAVKSAPPDGYTIMFSSISSQVVNPHLFKTLPYDAQKDFIPLAGTMKNPLVMITGPKFPFQTVQEFVAAAKKEPDNKYSFGSVSATTRLTGEMFAKVTGLKLLNVPYKSFTDFISDTLAGRISFFFADPSAIIPNISQGMRGVATCSKTRNPRFPDMPTMTESGFPLEVVGYHAAYAAAGTPAPVLAVLRDALRKAEASKPVQDFILNSGNEVMNLSGEAFVAYERSEFERFGKAIREAGLAGTI
jgi:tripartite-type tricarboxylate transporter receptor subunit TctC